MTDPAPTMIKIRPLPGADFESVPATPELDAYLARNGSDGTPLVVVWHGRMSRRDGRPVPLLITGAVFGRRIYGERAEVAGDLVVLAAMGLSGAQSRTEPLLDLAVPARLDDEPSREVDLGDKADGSQRT